MDLVIFNQKHNPQTSVGAVFTNVWKEGLKFRELFSQKGLAVIAFLCLLFVFILNTRLCPDDVPSDPSIGSIHEL